MVKLFYMDGKMKNPRLSQAVAGDVAAACGEEGLYL